MRHADAIGKQPCFAGTSCFWTHAWSMGYMLGRHRKISVCCLLPLYGLPGLTGSGLTAACRQFRCVNAGFHCCCTGLPCGGPAANKRRAGQRHHRLAAADRGRAGCPAAGGAAAAAGRVGTGRGRCRPLPARSAARRAGRWFVAILELFSTMSSPVLQDSCRHFEGGM